MPPIVIYGKTMDLKSGVWNTSKFNPGTELNSLEFETLMSYSTHPILNDLVLFMRKWKIGHLSLSSYFIFNHIVVFANELQ